MGLYTRKLFLAALVLLITTVAWSQQPVTGEQRDAVTQQYLNLPLNFELNRGQAISDAKFLARASGYGVMLERGGIAFVLPGKKQQETVRLDWIGAQAQNISGEQPLAGRINYLHGKDANQWITAVPTFARVRYQQLYPGIDLVYYGTNRRVEYDLIVAPGADPNRVSFQAHGSHLRIDNKGELVIKLPKGEVRQHAPVVYQEAAGKREMVSGRYVKLAADRVGFRLGKYDRSRRVIIDPTMSYATYLGAGGQDIGFSVAVDSQGSAFVTGYTNSPVNFPRKNAEQQTFAGQGDAFVTKFSPTGGSLIYSTFLGGSRYDAGLAIAVDRFGNTYLTGITKSADFPTTPGAFQQTKLTGYYTTFVTKLAPSGSSLVYSTYLNGSTPDYPGDTPSGLTVDSSGRVYVIGATSSSDFPTKNAVQPTMNGLGDAFVTRFTAAGALDYSTFLGGSSTEQGKGIVVDSSDNAYVTGYSYSRDFPTTQGAYEATYGGPNCQNNGSTPPMAFVTKLSPTGSQLVYSTYLGGCSTGSAAAGIAVDASNRAYVTGDGGSDFPTTPGAFRRTTKSGNGGGYVTRLDASGSSLSYSTFIGSVGPQSIAVDSSSRAWIAGNASNLDFPAKNPLKTCNSSDGFAAKLWATGGGVFFATCFGDGSGATSIRLDGSGNGYMTGETNSANFPTTTGAYDRTYGGQGDAFVVKIIP